MHTQQVASLHHPAQGLDMGDEGGAHSSTSKEALVLRAVELHSPESEHLLKYCTPGAPFVLP